jgi:hypothetical protein
MVAFKQRKMGKRSPILLPTLISLAEFAAFVVISAYSAAGKAPSGDRITLLKVIVEFLPNFGNFIVAAATTWYVVFTYHILRANADLTRQAVEPYLSVRWSSSASKSEQCFTDLNALTDLMRGRLGIQAAEVVPNLADRYVDLIFENQRGTAIGSLRATIRLDFPNREFNIDVLTLEFSLSGRTLGPKETVAVTVADLAYVPLPTKIDLRILEIAYSAIDSRKLLNDYYGNNLFNTTGRLELQIAAPLPKQEKGQ